MTRKRPGKFLPVLAAVLVMSLLFTGCGAAMKTAKVAAKFGTAMKQQPITSAAAELSCNVRLVENDTRFRTVVFSRMDWEQGRAISNVTCGTTVLGQELQQTMQCYSSRSEEKAVHYVHMDKPELWLRLENQHSIVTVDPALILVLLDTVSENTVLETRENPAGGTPHYVLKLCFNAEDIQDFMKTAGISLPDELEDCDLKGVTVPVELEIEDKTFLPIRLQASVTGITPVLMNALAKVAGRDLSGVDAEMGDITLLVTNFGYDNQDVPMLPIGAAENALDMGKLRDILKNR